MGEAAAAARPADDADKATTSQWTIERLEQEISYSDFLNRFLLANRPCILPASMTREWRARREWLSLQEEQHREDEGETGASGVSLDDAFHVLADRYGHHRVSVAVEAVTSAEHEVDEQHTQRVEMTLARAVERMKRAKAQTQELVYIKDWHLVRQERAQPNRLPDPYETPDLFADDWMNNCAPEQDDFRFCYAGTAGTSTRLHRDDTSYSWSTNINGRKRWRLFPPRVKRHLRRFPDVSTSDLAPSVAEMEARRRAGQLGTVSSGKHGWPEWPLAMAQCHEVEQEPGEIIFVPSDWHHEVENLTDCISLNHNWCNATNIASMYHAMCEEVHDVEKALCDVRTMLQEQQKTLAAAPDQEPPTAPAPPWQAEWTEVVQQVAAANAGWAWRGFWTMVLRNLECPPCPPSLRPPEAFVQTALRGCLADFVARAEYPFLDADTRAAVAHCEALLSPSAVARRARLPQS